MACSEVHTPRRIALTGGPGAGKTAVLELVRRLLCDHVTILPAERDFFAKAAHAIRALREELPACCREHVVELSRLRSA